MNHHKGHIYKIRIDGHWRKVRVLEILHGKYAKVKSEKGGRELTCGTHQLKNI